MNHSEIKTEEKFVDVPNGNVFVKIWRPQIPVSSVPLLLLHDSLGCTDMWRNFPEQLSAKLGRIVVSYDRLGFGRSSPRKELPSTQFVKEEAEVYLPIILDKLKMKVIDLFGHSVGGSMAIAFAAKYPSRCRSLITESSQVFVEQRTLDGISNAKNLFRDPKQFEKLRKYHGEKSEWVLRSWTDIWLSPDFASWSLAEDLKQVTCSVLAIHGDQDEYGSVRFPEIICELPQGPTEKVILKDTGHVPHREKPEEIIGLVVQFLKNLDT